jgi:hypothetical protein
MTFSSTMQTHPRLERQRERRCDEIRERHIDRDVMAVKAAGCWIFCFLFCIFTGTFELKSPERNEKTICQEHSVAADTLFYDCHPCPGHHHEYRRDEVDL